MEAIERNENKKKERKFIGVNLSRDIFDKINEEAKKQHRSLSAHIAYIIECWIMSQE